MGEVHKLVPVEVGEDFRFDHEELMISIGCCFSTLYRPMALSGCHWKPSRSMRTIRSARTLKRRTRSM
jgi:hypothetical protein